MPWGRLDDRLHDNGKVWSFSDKAFRVWMYSISYCNKKSVSDPNGALSEGEARALCRLAGATARIVAEIVEKRGWDRAPGGYVVHDFEEYGPFLDRTASERKRRQRARRRDETVTEAPNNGVGHGAVTRDRAVNVTPPIPIPIPIPSSAPSEHLPKEDTLVAVLTPPPAAAERASNPARSLEPRYTPDFEAWWLAYPRKREKVDAYAAYQKTVKAGAAPAELLAAAQHYAEAADEQGAEDRFIKLPATFLGPARPWLDFRNGVPTPPPRSPAANGHGPPSKLAQNAAILRGLLHPEEARG